MKKITLEQFEQFEGKTGKDDKIIIEIEKCKIREGIFISKDEWKFKTPPSILLRNRRSFNLKIKTKTLIDGSGWAILRIE